MEKINSNTYHLKLHSHIRTEDVFNVKHHMSFIGDNSSDEDAKQISRAKFMSLVEDDVERLSLEYLGTMVVPRHRQEEG